MTAGQCSPETLTVGKEPLHYSKTQNVYSQVSLSFASKWWDVILIGGKNLAPPCTYVQALLSLWDLQSSPWITSHHRASTLVEPFDTSLRLRHTALLPHMDQFFPDLHSPTMLSLRVASILPKSSKEAWSWNTRISVVTIHYPTSHLCPRTAGLLIRC